MSATKKDHDQIRSELAKLLDHMRASLSPAIDRPAQVVLSVISAKIASKTASMVESVYGTYSLPELLMAAETAAEAEQMEACLEGEVSN